MICKLIHFNIAVHHITFVFGFSVIVNLLASSPGKACKNVIVALANEILIIG